MTVNDGLANQEHCYNQSIEGLWSLSKKLFVCTTSKSLWIMLF